MAQPGSRWVPVAWQELPGLDSDALHEAWNAWVRSCERPPPAFVALCPQVRRLSIGTPQEQRAFLFERLQPYRIEATNGSPDGLLTGYYEPELVAMRQPGNGYTVPLYRVPAGLASRKPWYSRQQIDTLPEAQAQMAASASARRLLGDLFVTGYTAVKAVEFESYQNEISAWERRYLLPQV